MSTPRSRLVYSMLRRDALRDAGYCINGMSHGPRTHGVRCHHCHDVHRYAADPAPLLRWPGVPDKMSVEDIPIVAAQLADRRCEALELGELTVSRKTAQDAA